MTDSIQTPRACIDLITGLHDKKQLINPSVCTQINIGGYQISIAMDSSIGPGDLFRTDIRVFDMSNGDNTMDADVTKYVIKALNLPNIINSPQDLFLIMDMLLNHADDFRSGNFKMPDLNMIAGHSRNCEILRPNKVTEVEINGKIQKVAIISSCNCKKVF